MQPFYKIVLTIAFVVLILFLIVVGISMSKNSEIWPPVFNECPDYWQDLSGNGAQCVNVKDLGTCPAASGDSHLTMDFTQSPYSGSNSTCAKYTWANGCGVTWDGITYGANNPCI